MSHIYRTTYTGIVPHIPAIMDIIYLNPLSVLSLRNTPTLVSYLILRTRTVTTYLL